MTNLSDLYSIKDYIIFDDTLPVTQEFGDSSSIGVSDFVARIDHKHGIPVVNVNILRVNKTQVDSPFTMSSSDCSGLKVFTNSDAVSEVRINLPLGADGLRVNAIVTAAFDFTFVANGTETIRCLSTVSKAGGSIKSASIGDEIQMDWNGTCWVASLNGVSWQLETS